MTRGALYAAIRTASPEEVDAAIASLLDAGVIRETGAGSLRTTDAVRRLESLSLIVL